MSSNPEEGVVTPATAEESLSPPSTTQQEGVASSPPAKGTQVKPEEEMTPIASNRVKVLDDPEARVAMTDTISLLATREEEGEERTETNETAVASGDDLLGHIDGKKAPPGVAAANGTGDGALVVDTTTPPKAGRKEMAAQDEQALDEAFTAAETPHSPKKQPPAPRQRVHPETPIPNTDVALRLLRKFSRKTRPYISIQYGGGKAKTFFSYMFGSKLPDATYVAYQHLVETLYADGKPPDEESSEHEEDDLAAVVDGALGMDGDGMERARKAVASYVNVLAQWCHETAHNLDRTPKEQKVMGELLFQAMDTAAALVAHGCLDDVLIAVSTLPTQPPNLSPRRASEEDGKEDDAAVMPAVYLLAQAVLAADLSDDRTELVAMKFLLASGCRVAQRSQQALLRSSYLLQTIRLLYHIFLTTESRTNKVTARAALQQLVTSVFARMAQLDDEESYGVENGDNPTTTKDGFPSNHHRDAFLVLRSICKLSMRNLPDEKNTQHAHFGLQTSGSNDTWDGGRSALTSNSQRDLSLTPTSSAGVQPAQLIYTSAVHPALESKILALDLILYVLQNTDFSRGFIQRSGPQFHAAIRQYLCVSLLKNCTSNDTHVVTLSLRIFVPLVRNFRTILKNEIEAFVTNVFFVILDSKNSSAEHKGVVVRTFEEICSDPATLAEIFLNYDCDLSAVDLFQRIINSLSRVARTGLQEPKSSSYFGGPSASRMEKLRMENRSLRLDAMKALRQVLASLYASIVEPMKKDVVVNQDIKSTGSLDERSIESLEDGGLNNGTAENGAHNLVVAYGSKKKRRAEESEAILRFNQKPSKGIAYAAKCGHIDPDDPVDVARYLLKNKDFFEKTQIGELLGREPEYQGGFSLKVLHAYVRLMDFADLMFDEAIRFFLSGFRLPGEAQKVWYISL
jgi:hypothetical protein